MCWFWSIQIFGAPLLAQQFFQSPPFGCLKIFGAPPQYLHPPPPCHIKWTFPKQGFDGKKLSEGQPGRNSLCFDNLCCRLRRIGDRHAKILTVLLSPFSCLFSCYPPESFKIICLTCICSIWLKFVDTSFHSSQKPRQINPQWRRLLKNRCVKLKTPRELELNTYLAKSINFLWAKFGGNRK